MNCPKCRKRIPPGDKHCVYCGASTGWLPLRLFRRLGEKLPIWAKMLVAVVLVGAVAATALVVGNSDNPDQNSVNNQNGTQNNTAVEPVYYNIIHVENPAVTPAPKPILHSEYISGITPVIDGVLDFNEWGQPAFIKTFEYTLEDIDGTGYMEGYFVNDNDDLYAAIELKAEDFKEGLLESLGIFFILDIYFDGDNDDVLRLGEDVKRIWSRQPYQYKDRYDDCNFCTSGLMACPDNYDSQNGEGYATYSNETSGYTFEFRIPLNSGDPQDLAVESGDTIGVQVLIKECQEMGGTSYNIPNKIGWPTLEGWMYAETYAKLILASGSE